MAYGLKQRHLQTLLDDLLPEDAKQSSKARGMRANISQLLINTGINRKAFTARLLITQDQLPPPTELSAAAKT